MTFFPPKTVGKNRAFLIFLPVILTISFAISCRTNPEQTTRRAPFPLQSEQAIDINSAEIQDLIKLDGIGPKTAAAIIEHRNRFGRFRTPEQIMLVDGIGEKQYLKIRDRIVAN